MERKEEGGKEEGRKGRERGVDSLHFWLHAKRALTSAPLSRLTPNWTMYPSCLWKRNTEKRRRTEEFNERFHRMKNEDK